MKNPLLEKWTAPFALPPFKLIQPAHFRPAIEESIDRARDRLDKISAEPGPPSFGNTIEALDKIATRLDEISSILFNLNSADTNKDIQAAAREVSPLLSAFSDDITLNRKLFERIGTIYKGRESLELNKEQGILLRKTYRSFIRGGAGLEDTKRERFRQINKELASLSLKFEENVLEETNAFFLNITDEKDLEGLPEGLIESAAEEAVSSGRDGWVFTLHYPSYIPFMQYSARRNLREKMYRAYSSRAYKKKNNDNREIVRKIVSLRREKARLLGFANYAEYVLEDRMLDSPSGVMRFLNEMHIKSKIYALRDIEQLRAYAADNGHTGDMERWDWAYYAEKLKKSRYRIDDETLRPYFNLEEVQEAIFRLASDLYGLVFRRDDELPRYHKDVRAFSVTAGDGEHLAVLYLDYHPRKGKSSGAWMTAYRDQYHMNGTDIRPIISLVTNFSKASAGKPALISHNELTTFMHEFGHALHGMLSKCHYRSISGTNVSRDFVELPSQIMENWAYEKEWLDSWARHYITAKQIPADIIDKIKEALVFNEGYACNRQLGFAFLDMAWHTIEDEADHDLDSFEKEAMKETDFLKPVPGTNMSCSFGHLFSGGYAAGYYGYKWSEVLDADAYELFREKGIFDRGTADSFRENILEKGGSAEPMELYLNFRGKEPSPDALLKRSGFINNEQNKDLFEK
ncbi:MAG: M3 family metallopeptidase [Bacteroidales bacterium]|nr:M3 family metallopeptidase [Bacteroidales bacterium]